MNKSGIVKKLFMKRIEEPQGTDLVELKCQEVLLKAEVGSAEFQAAYKQLEQVRALKMAEKKTAKPHKIEPTIVAAGIGAAAQIACTAMIERYNAEGHLFPAKNITASWLGLNGLWTKVVGTFIGKK